VFRVGVESAFALMHRAGLAPVQVTPWGWNFDVFIGLSAPLLAICIATGRARFGAIVAWNLVGIAFLLTAIGLVASSVPGPLRANWPDPPFTAIATWPAVWIPAFFAPLGLALHVASLSQVGRAALRSGDASGKITEKNPSVR
jgi:hypothetical protein